MRQVLLTGAGGHVGRGLAHALAGRLARGEIDALTLLDLSADGLPVGAGIRHCIGDLGDAALRRQALSTVPDTVFHLAGITSRQAEDDAALGLRVNVGHTMALCEDLRAAGPPPVFVFTSSIGVYGVPLPPVIDDDTAPCPTLSYGTHKRMVELLLADHSRRGWLDARSVRLPSVVARPAAAQGALSSFASDLLREPLAGRDHTCPVDADAQLWWLSLPACVALLLQAALLPAHTLPRGRAWNLPALRASVGEVVAAMGRQWGDAVAALVSHAPQPALQAQFARWPPLLTATADRLGMRHDGDLQTLLLRALQAPETLCASAAPPLASSLQP